MAITTGGCQPVATLLVVEVETAPERGLKTPAELATILTLADLKLAPELAERAEAARKALERS